MREIMRGYFKFMLHPMTQIVTTLCFLTWVFIAARSDYQYSVLIYTGSVLGLHILAFAYVHSIRDRLVNEGIIKMQEVGEAREELQESEGKISFVLGIDDGDADPEQHYERVTCRCCKTEYIFFMQQCTECDGEDAPLPMDFDEEGLEESSKQRCPYCGVRYPEGCNECPECFEEEEDSIEP